MHARVYLKELDKSNIFFENNGEQNKIVIQTKYHPTLPLIIQGSGAGPIRTAACLFSNLQSFLNR
tara:strand:+ start:453 stop:647 length:195 start_codon:yes stop_codon:yes gene_type:complete